MTTDSAAAAAARELRARLGPARVLVRSPGYDQARRLWNGAVDHRPGLIVRPGTPAEVHQIAHAYGPNDARLRAAKARYDPYGIFAATPRARWRHAA
jgi:FAD/FMN-containing dehydrogenase